MHAATRILSATLAFAAAGLAHAQGGPDELWSMTIRMEMAGMPARDMTHQVCMKKGQTQPDQFSQDKNCKVAESRTSGNKTTWKIVCAGRDPMTGDGEVTRSRDSMDGRMRMQGKRGNESFDMTTVMSGKLAGGCTWEDPVKKGQAMVAQGEAQMAQMCRESMDKYLTMMFEGEQSHCKAQRAEYCGRVTKLSQSMRTSDGYRKALSQEGLRGEGWEQAARLCSVKTEPVRADACRGAVSGRDWAFVGDYCPVEAKKIAAEQCAGRSFTAAMASEYKEVCGKYARREDAERPAAAAAQQQKPGAAATPSAADAVKEGASQLRKLFGR